MNHLYHGDNLKVLRDSIATESVDLIYLDPPFNIERELQPAVEGNNVMGISIFDHFRSRAAVRVA